MVTRRASSCFLASIAVHSFGRVCRGRQHTSIEGGKPRATRATTPPRASNRAPRDPSDR